MICCLGTLHGQVATIKSVETYAGSSLSSGSDNGIRLQARFNDPIDLVFDDSGKLYIAEQTGSAIRVMDVDGNVTLFAGSPGNKGYVDATGTDARFNDIRGLSIDKEGNLIVADKDNHVIRRVTPEGVVTTIAGSVEGFQDGGGSVARFNKPTKAITDGNGNIYVADALNFRVRKIDIKGVVTTVVGQSTSGYTDGDVNTATLDLVSGLAFDASGNLIISTIFALRKFDFNTGMLSTIVGSAGANSFVDGDKDNAGFNAIQNLFVDEGDVIYIVDRHGFRHVDAQGTVTTLAGNSTQGAVDGAPLNSRFFFPRGIVKDNGGDFLVADKASHVIRRIFTDEAPVITISSDPTGTVNGAFQVNFTINESVSDFDETDVTVGNGTLSNFSGSGSSYTATITPTQAGEVTVDVAAGKITDAAGNTNEAAIQLSVVNDTSAPTVVISSNQSSPTSASTFQVTFTFNEEVTGFEASDISVTNAMLSNFSGEGAVYTADVSAIAAGSITIDVAADVAIDNVGNLNVAAATFNIDYQVERVLGNVEVYAGISQSQGSNNATRLTSRFNDPIDLVFDDSGKLYVAEQTGSSIRVIDTEGNVSTFAGSPGNKGFVDESGTAARFNDIRGLSIDNDGNLIVADKDNHAIRKVTPDGVVTTIAGSTEGFQDGNSSEAKFNKPTRAITDADGNLYVADALNFRVRKIDVNGNVTTVIGQSTSGYTDGDINTATLDVISGLAFDAGGDLIIATSFALRKFDFDTGMLSTIVGSASANTYQDGDKNNAGFNAIQNVFVDDGDVIYIVDRHALRYVDPDGNVSTLAGSSTQGAVSGAPLTARFFFPRGIVKDPGGDFLIADKASHVIRRVLTDDGPEVTLSTGIADPSNATSFEVTFTVSETVSDFAAEDVTVGNGTLSNFSGNGTSYTATITPTGDGEVTVDVVAGKMTDAAGNTNEAANQLAVISDQTKPVITISTEEADPTNATSFSVTFTLSETVSGFEEEDITVANATLSGFSGSGTSYTATVTPTQDGEVTLDVAADKVTDTAGNTNDTATQLAITSDKTKPVITISTDETDPTNATSFGITFTLSETVSGFAAEDVTVGNATLSDFSGSGTSYTATVTPAQDGEVTIDIAADKITDAAGNTNEAATQLAITSDQTKPVITISTDEDDPTNAASFGIAFTLSETVSDFAAEDVTVGNGSLSEFSGSGASYTATITPAQDGEVTLDIAADKITDAAGNTNEAATQLAVISDQTKPVITIFTDEADLTNATSFSVTFTLSETVSGFAEEDITVANATLSDFSGSGTSYTLTVTPTEDGEVTLDVAADKVTDTAGNTNEAATQLAVTSDQTKPVITISTDEADPTNATSFGITFTLSETVSDFVAEDVTVGNATLSDFSGSGTSYTATVTPAQDGEVTLGLAADKITDAAGNTNEAATQLAITSDQTKPVITISTDEDDLSNSASFGVIFTISETVSDFAAEDITVGNGALSEFSGMGTSYTATITPVQDGEVSVDVAADKITDAAGNTNEAATQLAIISDQTAPSIQLSTEETEEDVFLVTIEFSEAITGFDSEDISISDATAGAFEMVNESTYTQMVSTAGSNVGTLFIDADAALDASGNGNQASDAVELIFNQAPTDITIDPGTIAENEEAGTLVGNLNTTDPDATDMHSYSLVSGTGDDDNDAFEIEGGTLKTTASFDFETQSSYTIRVSSTDSYSNSFEKAITIEVTNVAEPLLRVSGSPDFPDTEVGATSEAVFTIHNDGDASLTVSSISYPEAFSGSTGPLTLDAGTSEEITITFTPLEENTYSGVITVASDGGSATLQVTAEGEVVTSIDDPGLQLIPLTVAPNPTAELLRIDLSAFADSPANISIHDMTGQRRFNISSFRESKLEVDVSSYAEGIYIVTITNDSSKGKVKVMVLK